MKTEFKPMLAATIDSFENLNYPVFVQPKIDGIRAILLNGKLVSRTLKPIPNKHVRKTIESWFKNESLTTIVDGELAVSKVFQETSSAIMSRDGKPFFKYIVFDWIENNNFSILYKERYSKLVQCNLFPITNYTCNNATEVLTIIKYIITDGYEGIIIRDPNSPYKFGRSTLDEGYLLKYKEFYDEEAIIINSNPLMSNANIAQTNELGYTNRSSHQANLVKQKLLGSWTVKGINGIFKNKIFNVGSGLTLKERELYWINKQDGKTITYKYQKYGVKDLPRSPIFKAFTYEK